MKPTLQQLESALELADEAGNVDDVKYLGNLIATGQYDAGQPDYPALFSSPEAAAMDMDAMQAFGVGAVRGVQAIPKALGMGESVDADYTQKLYEAVKQEHPLAAGAGNIYGETAPFMAAAGPIGGIASNVGRITATSGITGLEAATIAKADGATNIEAGVQALVGATLGGVAERYIPAISANIGRLYHRVTGSAPRKPLVTPDGKISEEFQKVLDANNVSFDELVQDTVQSLPENVNPRQARRVNDLDAFDAPRTRADVTGEFADQRAESRILNSPEGDELRETKLAQSRVFESHLDQTIKQSGVPEDVGQSLKSALMDRRSNLARVKREAYQQATDAAREVGGIPLDTQSLAEVIPKGMDWLELSDNNPEAFRALRNRLVQYGVETDPAMVQSFIEKGGKVTPLSVDNFERFRKSLNTLSYDVDKTGSVSVAVKPIIDALDAEGEIIDTAIQRAGITDESVLSKFREARALHKQLKEDFSPQSIAGRLTDVKRDKITPVVEASRVFNEVMGSSKAPELLERTIHQLRKSGKAGKEALGDLQAASVMELMESAFTGSQSRNVMGEQLFNPNAYKRRFDALGEKRLAMIFQNNKPAFNKLKALYRISKDQVPDNNAVLKGSAGMIDQLVSQVSRLPVLSQMQATIAFVATGTGRQIEKRRLMEVTPEMTRAVSSLADRFPAYAAVLGIAAYNE